MSQCPILDVNSTVYTVSQLNAQARLTIETRFAEVWVNGEISNLSQPHSGHLYFSLKDASAQIRCAFFKHRARQLDFKLQNGQQILLQAQVSLYESRGDFQLIVQRLQLVGDGLLQITFEKLKKELHQAGFFSPQHKKKLPIFPHCIGVVTSPVGAAIHDILQVLRRRFPSIPVIIYPTLVQGDKAATQIVEAIQCADQRQECDVLLLARGGGSLEDLWPFNEKTVAQAIFKCTIPILTGIGHEIDYTIADFVADQRAPTPSAAAEQISPSQNACRQALAAQQKHIQAWITRQWAYKNQQLIHLSQQLKHPDRHLQDQAQKLDYLASRLQASYKKIEQSANIRLQRVQIQWQAYSPAHAIRQHNIQICHLKQSLTRLIKHELYKHQQRIAAVAESLQRLSPLTLLSRGYAIITHQTQLIKSTQAVKKDDKIAVQLIDGQLSCRVETILSQAID